ncbi:MAG TPA: RluA family pseudouridine synthase [bacterium]|nr:RluA family pseudouridine synthase [bacterium]
MNEPPKAHHTYFVDEAHGGTRLDAFLARHLPTVSRSRIKTLIASGRVSVDGADAKPATPVRRGQRVEVDVPALPRVELQPEPIPLDVLYEDDQLMVINKPAGLTVHPGAGRPQGTLANAILARIPQLRGDTDRPGIVHRLDKDTSGALVVAKTPEAQASLQAQVAARSAGRRYMALVHGDVRQDEGTIAARIGRHPRRRTKMAVRPDGREAVTHYRIVERFPGFTMIEARLITGRTHQIRVHFAHLGHPVVGDPRYGGRRETLGLGRQALHAWKLEFTHPQTGRVMSFEAPLPEDIAQVLAWLRAREKEEGKVES